MKLDKQLDFETEFISDEEVKASVDAMITSLGEQIEYEENQNCIIRPDGIKAVLYTYKVLKYLTKNTKARVTYELNEPYRSMGSVSVTGKDLTFSNPEWFMVAVKLASNFNVYTKTDGTVQMDFTFHGLTKRI